MNGVDHVVDQQEQHQRSVLTILNQRPKFIRITTLYIRKTIIILSVY